MIRLFRVSIPASVLSLVFGDAVLLFGFYLLGAYLGLGDYAEFYLLDEGGLGKIAVVVALIQAGLYFQDLYDLVRRGYLYLVQHLCVIVGAAFLLQAVFGYGRWPIQLHKWVMVDGSLLTLTLLPLWRMGFRVLVRKAMPTERILFIGSSMALKRIAARLSENSGLGLAAIGYLDDAEEIPEEPFPVQRLGGLCDLKAVVEQMRPGRIVVGKTERRGRLPIEQLLELRLGGIHIEEAAVMYESVLGRISSTDLRPSQLVFSTEMGPRQRNVHLQTVYSLILGSVGLLVSLPIMAVVAVLVKATSAGPVFYRQTRVGLRGVPFEVLKFRSMYSNAEASTGAVWAIKGDPRITPVGRWLRQLRLDELPQFVNVVRGEMAVAGPRPERPEFCKVLEEQIPFYRQRHSVKPGITGWAQINHSYADTIEDSITKLEYDLYYIKNLTPSLDAYIIFHTFKVMLLSRGSR